MPRLRQCNEIDNYIIEQINEFNKGKTIENQIIMTPQRLHQLIYFCDAEYMYLNNGKSLFQDDYYTGPTCPIIPSIYGDYFQNHLNHMEPIHYKNPVVLSQNIKRIIDYILKNTKDIDTSDLVKISTMKDSPYKKIYDEKQQIKIIPKKDIYKYYSTISIWHQFQSVLNQSKELQKTFVINKKNCKR